MKAKNFTIPILCPKDHDMKKKDWFVFFRWTDPVTGKRIPVKKRGDLNSIESKQERIKSGNALASVYLELLESGQYPICDEPKVPEPEKTLSDWIDTVLLTKKSLKKKSYTDYEDITRIFKAWLKKKNIESIKVEEFSKKLAYEYLDYCIIERKNSGRTHNNQKKTLKTFFYDIYKRDRDKFKSLENPFAGIDSLPEKVGNNYALTSEERAKLKEYLYPKHKEFYFATCFMFYCCLRRPDIANIRFNDIDRKNMVLITHSDSAKSLRQEAVRMPPAMNKILDELEINKYPGTWYVFSQGFKPGPEKIKRLGDFTEFFRKVATKLAIDPVKSFYSYKHSGACEYFMITKNLLAVMRHLRHTEPIVTMKYLRSLGQILDDEIKNAPIEM